MKHLLHRHLINRNKLALRLPKFKSIEYHNLIIRSKLHNGITKSTTLNNNRWKWSALGLTLGLSLYLYNEDNINFYIHATSRGIMAVGTGLRVIVDYKLHWPEESEENAEWISIKKRELHQRNADRVLKAMIFNGGLYIKLGQHLTALNYFLPMEWCTTFTPLHDNCSPTDIKDIDKMVMKETGKSMYELFDEIEQTPIGVASIAQVYKAKYQNKQVAIKLQHPKVAMFSKLDIVILTKMVNLAEYVLPQFSFKWLIKEMKTNLPKELDFELEKNNAIRVKSNFDNSSYKIKIPQVYWATNRIICMEFVEGAKLNNQQYFKKHNISAKQVSQEINKIFSEMIFQHGFIHCDAHPGNIMVQHDATDPYKNFKVVLLDHGLYHTLTNNFKHLYANLWINILNQNDIKIKEYSIKLGGNENTYKLIKSILTTHSNQRDNVNFEKLNTILPNIAKLLSSVPNDLVYLFKTQDLLKLISYELNQDPILQFKILGQYSHHYLINNLNKYTIINSIMPYLKLKCSYWFLILRFSLYDLFYHLSYYFSPLLKQ